MTDIQEQNSGSIGMILNKYAYYDFFLYHIGERL